MNWKDKDWLHEQYVIKRRSTSDIAKELTGVEGKKVYPNTVRRVLVKMGFDIRDKSAAQKINIERNGAPMEGKTRTQEERERISRGLQNYWEGLDESEVEAIKEQLAKNAREKWDSLSKEDKNKAIKKMHGASRGRVDGGSKNENMVCELLAKSGYKCHQRTKNFSPGRRFEIDIAIPDHKIAIEWDGATHFSPIYGEDHLARVREKDGRKNAQLLRNGWTVIRCQDYSTAPTWAFCRRAVSSILDVIEDGKKNAVHIIEAR